MRYFFSSLMVGASDAWNLAVLPASGSRRLASVTKSLAIAAPQWKDVWKTSIPCIIHPAT
jgi:hypothetical protein